MMERAFLFSLVFLAIPALTIQMCREGYRESDGRCFFISDVERSFGDAIVDCQSRGGELAVIDTEEERQAAMEGASGAVPYWISGESDDLDFYSDAEDLNPYICEAPVETASVMTTTVETATIMTPTECPPSSPRPTEFDYEAALSESTALSGLLGPAVSAELGMDSFLVDLIAYQPLDGAPLADLAPTAGIMIQPDQWALTYTDPRTPGVTTALILPETRNFPSLGLPGEFPSYILPPIEQNLPLFYNTYLTNIEASYATSRAVTMETDDAIYGPDAVCPYPLRTDLGSGFALERLGTTLCKVNNRFTGVYPGDGRRFVIDVGIDWGRWWVGITIVITF